jgi:hypothetical protein
LAITKMGSFTLDWTTKATKISGQATDMKTWMNTRSEDIKTYINSTLIPALEATTDGASGANQIGVTTISGYSGANVQAVLEEMATVIAQILESLP